MPEDDELICAECGKSQGKKGSITQWMGLGDQCRCHLQADATSYKKDKKERKCRRCLKPKVTASQSMTGWLFKRDLCNCKDDGQSRVAPVQVAMSPRLIAGAAPSRANKILIGGIAATCCASIVLCTALIPDLGNVFHVLLGTKIKKGEERIIVVYDRTNFAYDLRFDRGAIATIAAHDCRSVRLDNAAISDVDLGRLGELTNVKTIYLKNCTGFSPAGLTALLHNDYLAHLALERCSLNQEFLEALASSHLETLDLSNSNAGNLDWECITSIPTLKELVAFGVNLSGKNKKYLEDQKFRGEDGLYHR